MAVQSGGGQSQRQCQALGLLEASMVVTSYDVAVVGHTSKLYTELPFKRREEEMVGLEQGA